MRIVFLGNGMTGYLDAQYRELHQLGHELMVVQPDSPEAAVAAMRDTAFGDLGTGTYAEFLGWQDSPRPDVLTKQVLEFDPDAVVMTAWNFAKAYRAVMKAVPAEVVRILVMDNLWRSTPRQWLGRAVHRWYIDTVADAAMVPSDRSEFYAHRLGFGAADVIRGSLTADTGIFFTPPRSGEDMASRRSFLFVGRLVDHKGADLLAEAYARYRRADSDPWDLHVVGMGPLGPMLAGLDGVTMHGFLPPVAVAALMREASGYLLPSHIEPYGVAVHEAAASGLPILCSDFAGVAPGLVQDGANGWIVPAGDVDLWVAAMTRMSSLSSVRLAAMSEISLALSRRISPSIWAHNLQDEIGRRRAAGGGRLTRQTSSR
ncbi:glycosyltransferase family 4 protein [Aeromicrobium sp.]|uniref:glycosyltransferase family 4 protein n=1 Tax=Aeromicrobium sp. TaxID=1871063 RepID=UPI00198A308B|nr:glycosyltransferase family 4 protein [Aeromicrobium sp.]MBC7633675.1 glycosyltransferase family 4 protein [Aeromicrobium sp.]